MKGSLLAVLGVLTGALVLWVQSGEGVHDVPVGARQVNPRSYAGGARPDLDAPAVELIGEEGPSTMRAELSASAGEAELSEASTTGRLSAHLRVVARENGRRVGAGLRVSVGLRSYRGRYFRDVPGSERELVLDEKGQALVELDDRLPDGTDPNRYGIWARVVEPGWCETRVVRSFKRDSDSRRELKLATWRGATLRGVLRDFEGEVVRGGELGLLDDAGEFVRQESSAGRVRAKTNGRFELQVPRSGSYTLVARRDKLGTARLDGLELDVSALPQDFLVTLSGEGVIAGRVLDLAGRPVLGYRIRAGQAVSNATLALQAAGNEGLRGCETVVDEEGRFRLTGLRPGDYRLLGRRAMHDRDETDLMGRSVATGGDYLELSAEQYVVTVRVLDSDGAPLEFVASTYLNKNVDELHVRVASVEPNADRPSWGSSTVALAKSLRVRPNVHYRVEARALDRSCSWADVIVTAADPIIELDLQAGPVTEPGRLVVAPRGPDGEVERSWRVQVTPIGSRLLTRGLKANGAGESIETSLAPGRYMVRIIPARQMRRSWLFHSMRRSLPVSDGVRRGPLRSVTQVVRITAREETRIEPRFGGSGWVRVLVELGTPSSEAAPRAKVTAAFDGHDEVLELGFPNGLHPLASEAQKSSVVRSSHGPYDRGGGIIPGLAQRAKNDLDVGRWRLRAELEGYAPAKAICDVRIDEEVVVRLVLEPHDG